MVAASLDPSLGADNEAGNPWPAFAEEVPDVQAVVGMVEGLLPWWSAFTVLAITVVLVVLDLSDVPVHRY